MSFGGGNGGTYGQTPTSAVNGGKAGDLQVDLPKGTTLPPTFHILVYRFGNGGDGDSPCGVAGANGADGGKLLWGAGVTRENFTVQQSFDGGNGSYGTPAGTGGKAGTDQDGNQVGSPGSDGLTC